MINPTTKPTHHSYGNPQYPQLWVWVFCGWKTTNPHPHPHTHIHRPTWVLKPMLITICSIMAEMERNSWIGLERCLGGPLSSGSNKRVIVGLRIWTSSMNLTHCSKPRNSVTSEWIERRDCSKECLSWGIIAGILEQGKWAQKTLDNFSTLKVDTCTI